MGNRVWFRGVMTGVDQTDIGAASQRLAERLAAWGVADVASLRSELEALLAGVTPAQARHFIQRLESTGASWGYHEPDPVARIVTRAAHQLVLEPGSMLENAAALEIARTRPVLLLGNHLSFIDANALDYLMTEAGFPDVAEHMTVLVGPKVYTHPIRRLASLSFGTINVAQSASLASGDALMSRREVARLAPETFRVARERREHGDHLLIFVEGTRSRTAAMQRALPAVSRYLESEDALLLPWAITGTERLMPIEEGSLQRTRVTARMGTPVDGSQLLQRCEGKRALAMDAVGFLIADLLPESYRGIYGSPRTGGTPAQEIARSFACTS